MISKIQIYINHPTLKCKASYENKFGINTTLAIQHKSETTQDFIERVSSMVSEETEIEIHRWNKDLENFIEE